MAGKNLSFYLPILFVVLFSSPGSAATAQASASDTTVRYELDKLKSEKKWRAFAAARDRQIQDQPPMSGIDLLNHNSTWMLNSDAWDVFRFCANTTVLQRALAWVELAISVERVHALTQYLDTRANILYKLGRVEEAIACEQKAIATGIEQAKKDGRIKGDYFDDYTEVLNKMKKGVPTW